MDEEAKNLVSIPLTVSLALTYSYFISSRLPIGLPRLISLLPVIYFFITMPQNLPTVTCIAVSTFFLTWLANFKLILFAFGRGPLSSEPSSTSLPIFMACAALPIQPKDFKNKKKSMMRHEGKKSFLDDNATKVLICAVIGGIFLKYREKMHNMISTMLFSMLIFLIVDCSVCFLNYLIGTALMKVDLEPPFDEPYLSTSLQEFWGRRWNIPVTSVLKEAVYKPVRSASAAVIGKDLAPAAGIMAAFLVSGLMHELLLSSSTGTKPGWDTTSFFVLQGFCVVLEFAVKKGLNGRLGMLPRLVSVLATVGFVWGTGIYLFFPPFVKSGYYDLVLLEIGYMREIARL